MSSLIFDSVSAIMARITKNRVPDPSATARKLKSKAIKRQEAIDKLEVKQTWNIVFGNLENVRRRDIHQIKDLTLRQIWMENMYIFNSIISMNPFPEERFHDHSAYVLQWKPPGSAFRQLVPLDDPQVQEITMRQIMGLKKRQQKGTLFFFVTKDPLMPMYQKHIHPASLVSYRSKPEVLNKLCQYYREQKLSLEDLKIIALADHKLWNKVLYNMLLPEERIYHEYLNDEHPKHSSLPRLKRLEQQYMKDVITFEQYQDEKFPERKRKREEEAASYPRPYETGLCVSCARVDTGIIKCQNTCCPNLVCLQCITDLFLAVRDSGHGPSIGESRLGPFVFLHRKFCMKFGVRPTPQIVIAPEPAYVRELQVTGKAAGCKLLPTVDASTVMQMDEDEEEDFDLAEAIAKELADLEEKKRQSSVAARERMEQERQANPEEFHALVARLKKATHTYDMLRKDVVKYQSQLEERGHNEHFKKRIQRLKADALLAVPTIDAEFQAIHAELSGLNISSKFMKEVESDIRQAKKNLAALGIMESMEQLENLEANVAKEEQVLEQTEVFSLFA